MSPANDNGAGAIVAWPKEPRRRHRPPAPRNTPSAKGRPRAADGHDAVWPDFALIACLAAAGLIPFAVRLFI